MHNHDAAWGGKGYSTVSWLEKITNRAQILGYGGGGGVKEIV